MPDRQHSLASLMLVIAAIGVTLGLIRQLPELGGPLALDLSVSVILTGSFVQYRRRRGRVVRAIDAVRIYTFIYVGIIGVCLIVGSSCVAGAQLGLWAHRRFFRAFLLFEPIFFLAGSSIGFLASLQVLRLVHRGLWLASAR